MICHGKRYAVYPSGCLFLIGPVYAMLHQAAAPTDYECGSCGRTFGMRSGVARFALAVIVILVLWAVAAVILAFVEAPE